MKLKHKVGMADYHTLSLATSNENGHVEIAIEYPQTVFQWVMRRPGTKVIAYLHNDGQWYNKISGKEMSYDDQFMLDSINQNFSTADIECISNSLHRF